MRAANPSETRLADAYVNDQMVKNDMSNIRSDAFKEFIEWFFHADSWGMRKEGPNLDVIRRLSPDERQDAESLLLSKLDYHDSWIIYGLGELQSKKAVSELEKALPITNGSILVAVCWALWSIEENQNALQGLLRLIENETNEYTLIEAAHALSIFPIERTLQTYLCLLSNSSYLVRYNSFTILGHKYHFSGIFADADSKLNEKYILSQDAIIRKEVLNWIIQKIREATSESLQPIADKSGSG